ncbi:MAG: hypothetical protein KDA95_02940 [Acidimicrobiales bacterium]|nr:hypothetical protein [Acidimicrobiales bacterium]
MALLTALEAHGQDLRGDKTELANAEAHLDQDAHHEAVLAEINRGPVELLVEDTGSVSGAAPSSARSEGYLMGST